MPDRSEHPANRYVVESIAFSPDLTSIMVRFQDPTHVGGPVIGESIEQEITLMTDDDLRSVIFQMADTICDVIDECYRERQRSR